MIKRSIGITILGWFIIISTLLFWPLFYRLLTPHSYLLIYNVLFSLLLIVVGIGILRLQPWARITYLFIVVIKVISICYRGITYIIYGPGTKRIVGIIDIVSVLAIASFIFWFLNRNSIKEQFKQS